MNKLYSETWHDVCRTICGFFAADTLQVADIAKRQEETMEKAKEKELLYNPTMKLIVTSHGLSAMKKSEVAVGAALDYNPTMSIVATAAGCQPIKEVK